MATITIQTNHFAIQLIETSVNGILRYDAAHVAAHVVRLDKDIFGKNKFSYCICIGYSGNDFIEVEEAALANPALVFDSAEAAHAAALEAVQNIVNHCEVLWYSIGQIFSGEGYAEQAILEQAEAENTEAETETRQAVLGIDAWKKQPSPVHFGIGSRAGVSLLAAQKMIRGGIIHDLNRLKAELEQVDARIALLEREESALEQRVTRLSNQDLSDFEPDKAARYIAEVCEAWLRAMLKIAGIELVNIFSPYQDATDVFKIECACSIEEFRERAHNAGLKPYSIVPIKGTSRSAWLYIQIGKP